MAVVIVVNDQTMQFGDIDSALEYVRVNKLEGVEFINYTMKPSLHFSDYKSGQENRRERRARERKDGKR